VDPSDRSGKPEPGVGRQLTTGRPAASADGGISGAAGEGQGDPELGGWLADDALLRAMGLGAVAEGGEGQVGRAVSYDAVLGAYVAAGEGGAGFDDGRWLPDEPPASPFAALDDAPRSGAPSPPSAGDSLASSPGLALASTSPLDELPAALVERRVREAERVVALLAEREAAEGDADGEPDDALGPEPAHARSRSFSILPAPASGRSALAALTAALGAPLGGHGLDEEALFALLARLLPAEMLVLHGEVSAAPLLAALLEEFEPEALRDRFFARSAVQLTSTAPLRAFRLLRGPRLRQRLVFLAPDERRALCDAVFAAATVVSTVAISAAVDATVDGSLVREAFALRWGLSLPAAAPPWPLPTLLRFHAEMLRLPDPAAPEAEASPPAPSPPSSPHRAAVAFAAPPLHWLAGAIRHELAHAVAHAVDVASFTEELAGWRTGESLEVWAQHLPEPWLPSDRRPLSEDDREALEGAILEHARHRKGTLTSLPPAHAVRRSWNRAVPIVVAAERCLAHADGSTPSPDTLFAAAGHRFSISPWYRRFQVCDESVVADRLDDPPLFSPEEHFAGAYTAFYEDQGLVPDAELGHRLRNPAWRDWFTTHIHDRGHGPAGGGEGR
jgi:hypothetical protein